MEISDFVQYTGLLLVGGITGVLNTIAGGGSLISVPILIFMGLPGVVANGTNRLALLVQNIFAVKGFQSKKVELPRPYTYYLAIVSLIGGLIGSKLALNVSGVLFNRIMAIVIVSSAISIMINSSQKISGGDKMSTFRQALGIFLFFLLGIYGGFIQAGIGFLSIAVLSHVNNFILVKTNYIKVFVALLYTGISTLVFALDGKIIWSVGIVLAIGQGIGGWYASRWSVTQGDKWIKRVFIIALIPMAIKLWFF